MDGTLLPKSKILNPIDLDAIRKLQESGGLFTVATGRSLPSAAQYFDELKINAPAVLFNGGVLYDYQLQKSIYTDYLHESAYDIIKDVLENFTSIGAEIDTMNMIYVPQSNAAEDHHIAISYKENEHIRMNFAEIPKENWLKILFADENVKINELRAYINKKNYSTVDFIPSSVAYLEMLPKDVSKGSALLKLIKMYKLHDYKVFAVGDYNNDLTMLEAADVSIAPSNAIDCVKEAADYITNATCDDGCIAEAINYALNLID